MITVYNTKTKRVYTIPEVVLIDENQYNELIKQYQEDIDQGFGYITYSGLTKKLQYVENESSIYVDPKTGAIKSYTEQPHENSVEIRVTRKEQNDIVKNYISPNTVVYYNFTERIFKIVNLREGESFDWDRHVVIDADTANINRYKNQLANKSSIKETLKEIGVELYIDKIGQVYFPYTMENLILLDLQHHLPVKERTLSVFRLRDDRLDIENEIFLSNGMLDNYLFTTIVSKVATYKKKLDSVINELYEKVARESDPKVVRNYRDNHIRILLAMLRGDK